MDSKGNRCTNCKAMKTKAYVAVGRWPIGDASPIVEILDSAVSGRTSKEVWSG
jgi:hypothetical protein